MKLHKSIRVICLVIISVMMLTLTFGCSGETKTEAPAASSGAPASTAPATDDKVYELKFSHHDPANGVKGTYFQKWAEDLKTASNGRLNITVYPSATLGATTDGINMVNTGITDILWSFTGFFNKQFQATDTMSLPLLGFRTAADTVNPFWDLYESMPDVQKEFKGFKVLMLYGHPPAVVGTNSAASTVADFKGLKMRVPAGPITDLFKEWGSSPISLPSVDIYESLSKNVINGFSFDWAGVQAFKLNEPINNFLDLKLYVGPMFIIMNEEKYNSLPEDLQQLIDSKSGRDLSLDFANGQDAAVESFVSQVKTAGKNVVTPSAEALAEFTVGADKIKTAWVKAMDSNGFDGTGLLNKVNESIAKNIK